MGLRVLQIGPGAERAAGIVAGQDDNANVAVILDLREQFLQPGIVVLAPGVARLRSAESDDAYVTALVVEQWHGVFSRSRSDSSFPASPRTGTTPTLSLARYMPAQTNMHFPSWLPWLLGLLPAIGPASIDMYLPAFTVIEASLGAQPGGAQITLASYFAGLAVGQMTQGTLSDRFGRRNPIIVGTLIYALASIGAALSPSIGWLTVFRAVSAFGGAAGSPLPPAVGRALATGRRAAGVVSRVVSVAGR